MENELNDKRLLINRTLFIIKFFAILSVVLAHCDMNSYTSATFQIIKQRFSSLGVATFLIVAGHYYSGTKYGSFVKMFLNKLKFVGIPWLVLGTIAYFWSNFHFDTGFCNISILGFVQFFVGYGSYLYYLPVLFFCFFVFYKNNLLTIIISFVLTFISLFLTSHDFINVSIIGLTNYLNVLNWVGFFALGLLMAKYNLIGKLIDLLEKFKILKPAIIVSYLMIVVIVSLFIEKNQAGYFSKTGLIMELFGFLALVCISSFKVSNNIVVLYVSKCSYFIYLTHMLIISVFGYVTFLNGYFSIVVPILVVGTISLLFFAVEFVFKKCKRINLIYLLLGVRSIK